MQTTGVSVIIATRGRPVLLRRALRSIFAQTTTIPIEAIVVFDQVSIDTLSDVDVPQGSELRLRSNQHARGLAGARNEGISAAQYSLIAFCDDDDEWLPSKLERQIAVIENDSHAIVVASGIRVDSEGGSKIRQAPTRTTFADLLQSRITELHPSTFLIRTDDLRGALGGIDEKIPSSYGEDYDLLLRASRLGHVEAVREPLVVVHWDRPSFFSEKWEGISSGLSYLLAKYPEFGTSPRGSARIQGQIAFAYAAVGDRKRARSWAAKALRNDRRQLRGYAAYAISAGVLPPGPVVGVINRRGRGL